MAWLDNARIIAILAVVVLHVAAIPVLDSPFGATSWWVGNLVDAFTRWCVPVFVMISGALLLAPTRQESVVAFYRKRLARILIPQLFWSAFFLFWTYLLGRVNGNPPGVDALLDKLVAGKPYYHLWFLYMLVPLYLVTPLLRRLTAAATPRQLGGLVGVLFALAAANLIHARLTGRDNGPFPLWFLSYTPYFLMGHLLSRTPAAPSAMSAGSLTVAACVATAAGCHLLGERHGLAAGLYFYEYLSLTVIPMSIGAFQVLRHLQRPLFGAGATPYVARLTLGVYLMHPVFIEILQRYHLGPIDIPPAIGIPLVGALAFAGALAASAVIHRIPYLRRII